MDLCQHAADDEAVIYQRADLAKHIGWQIGVNSDYQFNPNLHGLLGIKYLNSVTGTGKTNGTNWTMPAQKNHHGNIMQVSDLNWIH